MPHVHIKRRAACDRAHNAFDRRLDTVHRQLQSTGEVVARPHRHDAQRLAAASDGVGAERDHAVAAHHHQGIIEFRVLPRVRQRLLEAAAGQIHDGEAVPFALPAQQVERLFVGFLAMTLIRDGVADACHRSDRFCHTVTLSDTGGSTPVFHGMSHRCGPARDRRSTHAATGTPVGDRIVTVTSSSSMAQDFQLCILRGGDRPAPPRMGRRRPPTASEPRIPRPCRPRHAPSPRRSARRLPPQTPPSAGRPPGSAMTRPPCPTPRRNRPNRGHDATFVQRPCISIRPPSTPLSIIHRIGSGNAVTVRRRWPQPSPQWAAHPADQG